MEGFKPPKNLDLSGNISGNWKKFKQQFEIYMKATGLESKAEEVKVAIFLNLVGEDALDLYNTFNIPEADKKKLDVVRNAFETYCTPKKNVVYERYLFYKRDQKEDKPFEQFLTDIKKLSQTCEFDCLNEQMIRDRIVLGVRDQTLQERLLQLENLDLQKAIHNCKAAELMKSQMKDITEKSVDAIHRKTTSKKGPPKENVPEPTTSNTFNCRRCATRHGLRQCPAFNKKCTKCGRLNHVAKWCRVRNVRVVSAESESADELAINTVEIVSADEFSINTVEINENYVVDNVNAWYEKIKVEDKFINFKLDSGAEVNLLPRKMFKHINKQFKIRPTNLKIQAYGGFKLEPIGVVNLRCEFKEKESYVDFIIIENDAKPILGLETCVKLNLIRKVDGIAEANLKQQFLSENKEIFEGLGQFSGTYNIVLKNDAQPVVKPPRRVPLALMNRLKSELDRLISKGVITKVEGPVDWVSNLVIVEKRDKSLRLCLDPHDLNLAIRKENTLIPTMEEITGKLGNKKIFSVLDLKDGFWHIQLSTEASNLCTFSTPYGNYKFNKLPFGLCSAPELFQKINTQNFGDIVGVSIYFDDLLIAAESYEEHDKIMKEVVNRAKELGVKFNKNKLQYRVTEAKFLGHIFSKDGIKLDQDRIKAVMSLAIPQNKKELQRILGMVNFLRKYIPNLSELTMPLRELLKENVEFQWLQQHTNCFDKIKSMVSTAPTLANFDVKKEITIQSDASKNGLGCCLLQDGKPVCYASRALSDTEKNYAMIEKEFLGIVYATHKFHNFIYGRRITILTDHKPLLGIMRKKIADVSSPRLQRMKIKLLRYDLDVKYLPGKYMFIADLLSRSYLKDESHETNWITDVVHSVNVNMNITDDRRKEFVKETQNSVVLSELINYHVNGWPKRKDLVNPCVQYYFKFQNDITVEDGLIFFNNRIIVPKSLQNYILSLLHESHQGIEKTKARARQIVFWPGMSEDIENMIARCANCERYRNANVKEPLINHDIPELPFNKIAVDILELDGKSYLALQDYLSKWLEIIPIKSKTSSEIIAKLKLIFSTHGIPKQVVADNNPFNSYECKQFAKLWNFMFVYSSPRYPRSNGQAERAVQTAKNMLKKCRDDNKDLELALLEFRNTPVTGLHLSPSQILMSRRTNTKIPIHASLLKPEAQANSSSLIRMRQQRNAKYYNQHVNVREEFKAGDNMVLNRDGKWEPAKLLYKHCSPRSYIIQDSNGQVLRRNSSHLRRSLNEFKPNNNNNDLADPEVVVNNSSDTSNDIQQNVQDNVSSDNTVAPVVDNNQHNDNKIQTPNVRRTARQINKPSRYNDFHCY